MGAPVLPSTRTQGWVTRPMTWAPDGQTIALDQDSVARAVRARSAVVGLWSAPATGGNCLSSGPLRATVGLVGILEREGRTGEVPGGDSSWDLVIPWVRRLAAEDHICTMSDRKPLGRITNR
jgi:hypothetical protein